MSVLRLFKLSSAIPMLGLALWLEIFKLSALPFFLLGFGLEGSWIERNIISLFYDGASEQLIVLGLFFASYMTFAALIIYPFWFAWIGFNVFSSATKWLWYMCLLSTILMPIPLAIILYVSIMLMYAAAETIKQPTKIMKRSPKGRRTSAKIIDFEEKQRERRQQQRALTDDEREAA